MANISPTPPSFTFGYWRPWKENSNYFDSYFNYAKDVSLAKYQADTVGQYISQASSEQIQAIGELGDKIGLASYEQMQTIEQASYEQVQAITQASHEQVLAIKEASKQQVQAIGELGNKIEKGLIFLFHQMSEMNHHLCFLNKNLDIQIEQQKVTNLLLENISELLRVPDSEKERQHSIELGLKFFVNALQDDDLFADALEELLEAEKLMKQDYFVLHRIGLIYMYSLKHINPQMALDYFAKAAKYASVESDPKAARLVNALTIYGDSRVNTKIITETNAIQILAADSYEKAAFAAYVLGNFELAVTYQSKAVKFNNSAENYFFLAKYQTRTKQIDLLIQNISKSIDEIPEMALAVFKDLDLVNEPEVLKVIEEKNIFINNKIYDLINRLGLFQSESSQILLNELKKTLNKSYDKKVKIINKIKCIGSQIWQTENLDVDKFRNGDTILEAKTSEEWLNAGIEKKPAWCYYDYNHIIGKKFGKLYNWYVVNDPRNICPEGWHIPSEEEWTNLISFLGGKDNAGKKLKSTIEWDANSNGTNESEFSALPSGLCGYDGTFLELGIATGWWSTKEVSDRSIWIPALVDQKDIDLSSMEKEYGLPIRCLLD